MIKINLLPRDIVERRKAERRWVWVSLGGLLVGAMLLGVYGIAWLQVQEKGKELQAAEEEARRVAVEAELYRVFEVKAIDVQARSAIAQEALAERYDWPRLLSELALVLPSDIWLQTLNVSESDGMQLAGYALDDAGDTPDVGHKAVAKMLARLAELEQAYDVWLENSLKTQYTAGSTQYDVIQFTARTSVISTVPTDTVSAQ